MAPQPIPVDEEECLSFTVFTFRGMSSLNVTLPSIMVSARRPQGKTEICDRGTGQVTKHCLGVPGLCSQPFRTCIPISQVHRLASSAVICAAALNARCGAEQTQTVTRQSSTITIAPVQGKEKSPELDDGGTGLPPRDDGDGGGGGGGGGGGWAGGFFFFGFLAFLGLLKDKENEGPYRDTRRR